MELDIDIPIENIQDDDGDGSGQAMMDCLGLPEIVRKIMDNFSSKELLQLSLVNKQWNYEARSLMRNRRNLTARIIKKKNTSQPLLDFASDLRRMKEMKNVVPLSGMTLNWGGWNLVDPVWFQESSAVELDSVVKDLLHHVTWKHLSVNFLWDYKKRKNFPDLVFAQKILQNVSSVLEELSLVVRHDIRESIQELLQDCSFPCLKNLKLREENATIMDFKIDANLIKRLVSRAPNLQVVFTQSEVDLTANVLEGSSATHVTNFRYSPCVHEIPASIVGELRLQRMDLTDLAWDFNAEKFNMITPMLLQTSRSTLSSIQIHAVYLLLLMQFGVCLENVKNLEMHLDYNRLESIQPHLLRLVKSFDFTRIFPKLNAVTLNSPLSFQLISKDVNKIAEHGYTAFMEPTPERAVNIKTLRLDWPCFRAADLENSSGQFLAHMFPDTEKLDITATDISFGCIWDSWPELKELKVTLKSLTAGKNYESVFCGIFPQEVAELRKQDEEYLRNVNIVPVMPAITCLKGLRTFDFSFGSFAAYDGRVDNPNYMFSKVTGSIAFKRCTNLTVTLRTGNPVRVKALSHLKPYVTVVLR